MINSFKYRFIISFVTVEIFFILCIVTVNFFTIDKSSSQLIKRQIESTTLLMSELVKSPISVYDIATLDNIVTTSNLQNINSIIILDSQKRILSQKYNFKKPIATILNYTSNSSIKIENEEFHIKYTPIMVDDVVLGYMYIVYDMNEFANFIKDNTKHTFSLIILEIIISTFISYLIGSKLTYMLTDLSKVAKKIGQDDDENIEIPYQNATNEIGDLSKSMHQMRTDIQTRNKQLKEIKKVFDNIKEAIVSFNQSGQILLVNNAFKKIVGFEEKDIINNEIIFLQDKKTKRQFIRILKSLELNEFWQGELVTQNKNHEDIILWLNISKVYYDANNFNYTAIFTDITVEKEKESLLQIQSKMATMGEMLGNIAHQWRQPLSAISSLASGMKLQSELEILDKTTMVNNLDNIVKSAYFLSDTIEDFRNFFSTDKKSTNFTVSSVLEKDLSILNPILKSKNIEYSQTIIDDPLIQGFENELVQAFLNIVNNAKDVLTDNNNIDKKVIHTTVETIGQFVNITITDNGGGISQTAIDKIFEPYFTTKHQSQGTGIGLYMTHTIITKHFKGLISVKNKVSKIEGTDYVGASFTIKLPLSI